MLARVVQQLVQPRQPAAVHRAQQRLALADKRAPPPRQLEIAFALERLVGADDRILVDAHLLGELTHGGQLCALRIAAVADARFQNLLNFNGGADFRPGAILYDRHISAGCQKHKTTWNDCDE